MVAATVQIVDLSSGKKVYAGETFNVLFAGKAKNSKGGDYTQLIKVPGLKNEADYDATIQSLIEVAGVKRFYFKDAEEMEKQNLLLGSQASVANPA